MNSAARLVICEEFAEEEPQTGPARLVAFVATMLLKSARPFSRICEQHGVREPHTDTAHLVAFATTVWPKAMRPFSRIS
jgi:hypothetical protein